MLSVLNPSFLFASLIWGSVGVGYCVYGRRQQSPTPLIGGILVVAVSYFASSVTLMSMVSLGLIATIHLLLRKGY